jgi:hypothetical protein
LENCGIFGPTWLEFRNSPRIGSSFEGKTWNHAGNPHGFLQIFSMIPMIQGYGAVRHLKRIEKRKRLRPSPGELLVPQGKVRVTLLDPSKMKGSAMRHHIYPKISTKENQHYSILMRFVGPSMHV